MVSIKFGQVSKRELADKFIEEIQGQTFMNFQVTICPAYGSFDIMVETEYTDDEAAAQSMLNLVMFDTISALA